MAWKIRPFGKKHLSQPQAAVPHRTRGAPSSDWLKSRRELIGVKLDFTTVTSGEYNNDVDIPRLYSPTLSQPLLLEQKQDK